MKKYSLMEFNNGTRFFIYKNSKIVKNFKNLPKYIRFDIFNFFIKKGLLIISETSYVNNKLIYLLCERINEDGGVVTYIKSYDLENIINKGFELLVVR